MSQIVTPVAKENRPVTIVVLAKYDEVFVPFLESLERFVPRDVGVILVQDGRRVANGQIDPATRNWKLREGKTPFSMAGNGNIGLKDVPPEHDVLYVGDDVRFLEHNTIARLQEVAYAHEDVGILSPRIIGRGSPAQTSNEVFSYIPPLQMWFPCVYIKRELINKIGFLDEQFSDFGCDDFDYCIRTLQAGYKLAVAGTVTVQHEASPEGGPTTFVKNIGVKSWREQEGKAQKKICEKYGVDAIGFKSLCNGDLSVLKKVKEDEDKYSGLACTQAEAKTYLQKQSIFIATPVYGGNTAAVNYMHSLLGLVNTCRDLGVGFDIHFMYNESLITRARNCMVNDFKKSECTHFLFIDCDISFDPRDIILMLMQKEEIIGAPCVRKGLRWDRITHSIKSNPTKNYTGEDLEKITGQYVVNFLPENTPKSIDLGKLIEVRNVGTGIMLVRRHVFNKIEETFPNNWYLQTPDELGGRVPIYMHFQAELDDESRQHNPGNFPDYISEDYSFCKLARKSGIRVWLAPWLKTGHFGSYLYHGDLKAVSDSGGSLR